MLKQINFFDFIFEDTKNSQKRFGEKKMLKLQNFFDAIFSLKKIPKKDLEKKKC